MKPLVAFLVLAALSGCPHREPPPEGPVSETYYTQQKQICERQGGRWGQGGGKGFMVCYTTLRDGGKECRKAGDCSGLCLARSRSCAPVKPLFGCQDILNDVGERQQLCLD